MQFFSKHSRYSPLAVLVLVTALLAAGGWTYHARRAQAANVPETVKASQAPSIEVLALEKEEIRRWVEFSGRLQPVDFVEIRPRVGGIIHKVLFQESAIVQAGTPLFVIDPRPFEAATARAEAQLASARSQAELAGASSRRPLKPDGCGCAPSS